MREGNTESSAPLEAPERPGLTTAVEPGQEVSPRAGQGEEPHPQQTRIPRRCLAAIVVLAVLVLAALLAEAYRVLMGANCHVILDGRVYRIAQPSAEELATYIRQHGIRTVINLRGCNAQMPWYQEEMLVSSRLDTAHEDLYFSASRLPPAREVQHLIEILDRAEYPILIHCWRGADRTGLAAAIAVLLHPGATLAQAREQMGIRYGHVALGRPTFLDQFFDYYEQWLRERMLEHEPRHFRHWAAHEYRGGHCLCRFESCTISPPMPRVGEPFTVHVRVLNASKHPWRFKPTRSAGIHLGLVIFDETGQEQITDRSGLRAKTVAPGEMIDLIAPVRGLDRPGRYRVFLDMVDEQLGWFYQMGSDPLERELIIRE